MPKLPPQIIIVQTKTEGKLTFEIAVSVSSSGWFRVACPDVIKETVQSFQSSSDAYQHLVFEFSKGTKVCGQNLEACIKFLTAALKSHFEVTTTTECFLVFKYTSGLRYWKNPDGSITHNGGADDAVSGGRWSVRAGASAETVEGLLLSAFAANKTTHVRAGKTVVEWGFWRAKDHFDDSDIRARLNSISQGVFPTDPESMHDPGWTILPFEETSAHFFYLTIHSLCRIDDQLRTFFSDKSKVVAAISSGGVPFLTHNPRC